MAPGGDAKHKGPDTYRGFGVGLQPHHAPIFERKTPVAECDKLMKRGKPLKRTPMKKKPRRGGPMPQEVYEIVMWSRARGECEIRVPGVCTKTAGEWSHRQRRQRGNDTVVNGLAACAECHRWCHSNPEEAKGNGWMVHSHHPNPGEVPVWWRGQWWLLTDGGGRVLTADGP